MLIVRTVFILCVQCVVVVVISVKTVQINVGLHSGAMGVLLNYVLVVGKSIITMHRVTI